MRVGIVGAGQLARMTHAAAIDLGIEVEVLAAARRDAAVLAGAAHRVGEPSDLEALAALAARADVLTVDHERIPPEHLRTLEASGVALHPGATPQLAAQDKLYARELLDALGLPVPAYAAVADAGAVEAFAAEHGWPVVLKARRGGYDGRGVRIVSAVREAERVLGEGGDWVAEAFVAIRTELSALVVQSPSGELVDYPLARTVQHDAMCREIHVPAGVAPEVEERARAVARRVARALGTTGVLAVELFETSAGDVLVNELALRPHNSGHWTIEGSVTSQFHNHLRAVCDWPLGLTRTTAPVIVTVNVVGPRDGSDPRDRLPAALSVPGAHVHLYGKESRPGRKLGHVTVLGEEHEPVRAAARLAAELLQGEAVA